MSTRKRERRKEMKVRGAMMSWWYLLASTSGESVRAHMTGLNRNGSKGMILNTNIPAQLDSVPAAVTEQAASSAVAGMPL